MTYPIDVYATIMRQRSFEHSVRNQSELKRIQSADELANWIKDNMADGNIITIVDVVML